MHELAAPVLCVLSEEARRATPNSRTRPSVCSIHKSRMKDTGAHAKHFGKPPTWLQARRARGAAAAPCDADAWGQQDPLFVEADAYVLFAARPETWAESRTVH